MLGPYDDPLLHHLLEEVFIEKWGRGISLILSNEPTADFKESGTHFITTFKRKSIEEQIGGQTGGLGEKLGEKLGENQKKILDTIRKNNQATISELSKTLRISTTSVEKNIAKLKEKGILKRVGPDKGGRWEIANQ